MSYRERFAAPKPPTDQQTENFLLRQAYRNVFSTTEGLRVLDDICQRLCGLDAIVAYNDPVQAVAIIERQNVGKQIAALALAPELKPKSIEVDTHGRSGS